jgi:hypothetical protein
MGIETGTIWKCDSCNEKTVIAKNAPIPYPLGWVSMEIFTTPATTVTATVCSKKCLLELATELNNPNNTRLSAKP